MSIVLNGSGSITGLTSGAGIAAAALSGQVPDANAPSGSVIQVVHGTSSTVTTITTSTFTDVGLSATITPSSATSKILIFFSQQMFNTSGGNAPQALLLRDATGIVNYGFPAYAGTSPLMHYFSSNYLDSPATTSTLTYKLQVKLQTGSGSIIANYTDVNGTPVSVITLMEIAA